MSKRIATAVAIIGAAGVISGCALEQPSPGCQVQDSDHPWQAKYTLKNPGDAAKACGTLQGEAVGFWKYVAEPLGTPRNQLVIRPAGTATRFSFPYEVESTNDDGEIERELEFVERIDFEALEKEAPGKALQVKRAASTGVASLASEPDANGLCLAEGFASPATVNAAEARHPVTNELFAPAESITYTYTNVQVYSAPSAPGTQAKGTFKYSVAPGEECEYEMTAIWPQVFCNADATDAAERCGEGSGINPDFDVVCDESLPDIKRDDDHDGIQDRDDDDKPIFWKGACVANPAKGVPAIK